MSERADEKAQRCRFWHRWQSIEEATWLGGIASPAFLIACRRCGATKTWRAGA